MSELDKGKWQKEIKQLRAEKDEWMRTSPYSPIPHEIRHDMKGLDYFPPDARYRFVLRLSVYPNPERLRMATSKGQERDYLRYGSFEFEIEGKTQRLQVYKAVPAHQREIIDGVESLFVPFRDTTSGKESYGAARYIDLEMSSSGVYVLDFNLAYNPYCAYSEDYVCPFPPPENWMKVPIMAGEKNFQKPEH